MEGVLGEYIGIILALLLLEAVLSFDNAAILAAIIRKLPKENRRKALLYGLVGAYALRITAILGATILIQNEWLKFVGGGYLLLLFFKHFYNVIRHKEEHHHEIELKPQLLTRLGVPMLAATIIQIELIDLAFALDQVLAAVAFVDHIPHPDSLYLIIAASMIGILFLRIAAVYVARVMDWLPILEHMAYIAVAFVGVKLVLGYHKWEIHLPTPISLGFTFAIFGVPVLTKLLFNWPKSAPGTHVLGHGEEE